MEGLQRKAVKTRRKKNRKFPLKPTPLPSLNKMSRLKKRFSELFVFAFFKTILSND